MMIAPMMMMMMIAPQEEGQTDYPRLARPRISSRHLPDKHFHMSKIRFIVKKRKYTVLKLRNIMVKYVETCRVACRIINLTYDHKVGRAF